MVRGGVGGRVVRALGLWTAATRAGLPLVRVRAVVARVCTSSAGSWASASRRGMCWVNGLAFLALGCNGMAYAGPSNWVWAASTS